MVGDASAVGLLRPVGVKGEGEAVLPPGPAAGEAMSRSLSDAIDDMSDALLLADAVGVELSRPRPALSRDVNDPEPSADPPKKPDPTRLGKKGVCAPLDRPFPPEEPFAPGVWGTPAAPAGGCNASREACKRRLVVPRALVWDERAEQTRATRELGM